LTGSRCRSSDIGLEGHGFRNCLHADRERRDGSGRGIRHHPPRFPDFSAPACRL
jgi:hypothetical protein